MQYTVLVRQYPGGMYEAIAPAAPGCKGEGRTRREALRRLKAMLKDWLVSTEITMIEVKVPKTASPLNPWLMTAGVFRDDPWLEPMLREIYAAREAEKPEK